MKVFKGTDGNWNVGELDETKVWGDKTCVAWSTNEAQNRNFYIDKAFEEMKANAKLIAAAPELLKTLLMISKIENVAFGLKSFNVEKLKKEINKAISKALY